VCIIVVRIVRVVRIIIKYCGSVEDVVTPSGSVAVAVQFIFLIVPADSIIWPSGEDPSVRLMYVMTGVIFIVILRTSDVEL